MRTLCFSRRVWTDSTLMLMPNPLTRVDLTPIDELLARRQQHATPASASTAHSATSKPPSDELIRTGR